MDEHQFEVEGAERPYVRPLLLGSPKNISTPCYLTGLLDATAKIHMKRKGTGVRILMRLLGIGSNVVVGWRSTRDMSNLTPLTPRSY